MLTTRLNGRKNAGFAPPSLSIASTFAPLNEALAFKGQSYVKHFTILCLISILSFAAHGETVLEGLALSISETPYSAIIEPISYTVNHDIEKHEIITTIRAKMVSSIRGDLPQQFDFIVVSEIGDTLGKIGEPILIAFCKFNESLYFAGVGAAFIPSDKIQTHAKLVVKKLSKTQSNYGFCKIESIQAI